MRERAIVDGKTVAAMGIAGLAYALAALQPIDNPDTFGHLAQGRVIDARGGPPVLDPFSFWRASPVRWPNYEWLSDWIGYRIEQAFGIFGLHAITIGIAALGAILAVWLASRRGGPGASVASASLLLVALPAVRFRLFARPDMLSLPLALLQLMLVPDALANGRSARSRIALAFVIQLAWANLHGSHLLGIGIAAAAALASFPDRARMLRGLALTVMLAGVSCWTPFGPELTFHALAHVFDPSMRAAVTEWQPWSPALSPLLIVVPLLFGLAMAVSVKSFARAPFGVRTIALVALVFLAMALRSTRFIPLCLGIGSCALATLPFFDRLTGRMKSAIIVAGSLAVSVAGMTFAGGRERVGWGIDTRLVPAGASATIAEYFPEARVLSSMSSSWYLLYGAPEAKVLLDGRVPFYGGEHASRVASALSDPAALASLVEAYPVELLLLSRTAPTEVPAVSALANDSRFFALVHLDASWVVFARRGGRYEGAVAYLELRFLRPDLDAYQVFAADDRAIVGMERELEAYFSDEPDERAFASYVRALIRLRPLARAGGLGGLAPPTTEESQDILRIAAEELRVMRDRVEEVQGVTVWALLVAIDRCELDEASALLEAARAEGPEVRETLFAAMELDLRRGDVDGVRARIAAARARPNAEGDPWIEALEGELADPPRCR